MSQLDKLGKISKVDKMSKSVVRQKTKPVGPAPRRGLRTMRLERILKGCANRHRVAILHMLQRRPQISLHDVAGALRPTMKTVGEHLRKMYLGGLVKKERRGRQVLHRLSPRGQAVLDFLRQLQET